jgi:hypothetical protein
MGVSIREDLAEAAASDEPVSKGKKAKVEKRKGNRSWVPAAPLAIKSADKDYRLKWVYADAANVMRKRAEGFVNAEPGDATHDRPPGVESGTGRHGSVTQYRDMVLMKIPEEMALARAEFYEEAAKRQLHGVKSRSKQDLRDKTGVTVTGDITIE